MNSSSEQLLKAKRDNYRNELRKQELNSIMTTKRQKLLEQSIPPENGFLKYISSFSFIQTYNSTDHTQFDPKAFSDKVFYFSRIILNKK